MALPDDDHVSATPQWVVTYGDMMSLLLTFFIMLVSLSELKQDKGKLRAALDAIREAFGADVGESGAPGRSLQTTSSNMRLTSRGVRSEGGFKRAGLTSAGRGGPNRTVQRISHGAVITLGGPSMFEAYGASLSNEGRRALDLIASHVRRRSNRIVVRGHASPDETFPRDDRRAAEGGPLVDDAWDLSYARAYTVAAYLIGRGVDRHQLLVNAAGAAEPRVRPRDRAAQQQNRRVDVFVIDSYIGGPRQPGAGE